MPHKDWLLNISILASLLALIVFLYFLVSTGQSSHQVQANSYTKEQIINAINIQREQNNLSKLTPNDKLNISAQAKADDMKNRKYFSHIYAEDGTKWSDFIEKSGYNYSVAGENLANGFYNLEPMIEAWMNSPTHRENVLNPKVDETGVGISFGELNGNPTIFVVQVFGKQVK
jgi:uncharacterized protein YkwD